MESKSKWRAAGQHAIFACSGFVAKEIVGDGAETVGKALVQISPVQLRKEMGGVFHRLPGIGLLQLVHGVDVYLPLAPKHSGCRNTMHPPMNVKGEIIGYNAFYRSSDTPTEETGGARKRTFRGLEVWLEKCKRKILK